MTVTPRADALEQLGAERFDVLVIGAGITGARVAYDLAHSGHRVALVDAGDIASGTSSASSKLLHGGFRYLALHSYGLVRSAQLESRVLATRIAPHLSRPLPVLLGVERGRWPEWQLSSGLLLYFGLSGFRPPRPQLLDTTEATAAVPCLSANGDRIHILLHEFQTDDGRLVLATAVGAARAGAVVAPYVEVVGLAAERGRVAGAEAVDRIDGCTVAIRARCVINASGAWVDRVRELEDPRARPIARLSKGVHVTVPLPTGLNALVASYSADDRTRFAAPWRGTLLLGTTDTELDGDPTCASATGDEIAEVVRGGRELLDGALVDATILSAWAGVRVLPRSQGATARVPREHLLEVGPARMISVAGGKLTTHRRISADVLRLLPTELRPRRALAHGEPLPGALPYTEGLLEGTLDAETASHLRSLYGSEAPSLLDYADEPDAFERIHPAAPDVWAQVPHGREREWALTVDDVVRRRTTLAYRGLDTELVREAISRRLATPAAVGAL